MGIVRFDWGQLGKGLLIRILVPEIVTFLDDAQDLPQTVVSQTKFYAQNLSEPTTFTLAAHHFINIGGDNGMHFVINHISFLFKTLHVFIF